VYVWLSPKSFQSCNNIVVSTILLESYPHFAKTSLEKVEVSQIRAKKRVSEMEVVREITVEDDESDIEYSTFEAEENSGSVQHIQKEIQGEVFATLHLRSIEEDSPKKKFSVFAKCSKTSIQVILVVIIWAAVSGPSVYYAIVSCGILQE